MAEPGKNPNEEIKTSSTSSNTSLDEKKIVAKTSTHNEEGDPFANLSANEAEILKRQVDTSTVKVSYLDLYRYATKRDLVLVGFAYMCSLIAGAALPLFTLVFGSLVNTFSVFVTATGGLDEASFQSTIDSEALYFLYLGIGIIVFFCTATAIHVDRGEVISSRIRKQYLKAILKQNIGYFDKLGSGEVTTRITNDTNSIQEGISEKAGFIVNGLSTFVAAFIIAFIRNWKLAFILCSVPITMSGISIMSAKFIVKYTVASLKSYGKGSTIAEESFSAIRTTIAFGTQSRLAEKFDKYLIETRNYSITKGRIMAVMIGAIWGIIFMAYSLAFWEGSRLLASGELNIGVILTVIMSMMIGAFQFGNVAPSFQAVGNAIGAANKIYEAIDRASAIDSSLEEGKTLDEIKGHIKLSNVKFIYPSRPDVTILENMNLEIMPGQTVALVGASGSGKSTIVGLLERFYNPVEGKVEIDGVDTSEFNVKWLRQQIALVSQEPTLFSVSIYENICYGLIGTPYEHASEEVKREMVIEACKLANAWEFIQAMTDVLETNVGERGFLMSGGQKQRIAIARAIISNPKILLLDEATSALDTKSEGVVQEALDRAAKSRTTIVIAHRLSTIKDADKIVVMSEGEIIETGTHSELLDKQSAYYKLVEAQTLANAKERAELKQQELEYDNAYDDEDDRSDISPKKYAVDDVENSLELAKTGSVSSQVLAKKNRPGVSKEERSFLYLFNVLYQFNKKEKYLMIGGTLFAIVSGCSYPSMSILYAKIIGNLMVPQIMFPHMRQEVNKFTGFLFMVGIVIFFSFATMTCLFSYSSEHLVRNIRLYVFKHYLRMDVAFFDRDENTTGALTATLAKDAQSVQGLGGATLGQILQCIVTLVVGVIVAISLNWRLGLVCTSAVPVLVGCGYLRFFLIAQLQERAKKHYEDSASYACESINAIRTVSSLTREDGVLEGYAIQVDDRVKKSRPSTLKTAFLFALAQGLGPWVMGLAFWYGSTLLRTRTISSFQFFVAFSCVVFGSQAAGAIFSHSPDMGKAKQAANNLSHIMDIVPEIDTWSDEGQILDPETVKGDVEFCDVHFRYPTRPQVPVLRGLNLTIKKGQYVALVGASGCGKSTTISLVERFYSPLEGKVTIDGHDISKLNINHYRSHIALVQQEPVLYSGSIRENIMLGTNDPNVTDEEMYAAAQKANIHDFVMSLPDGYNTLCGSKGALLSGGQKQRVAIARALIRNPKVLLLDEATSALDSESEKVVQQALDEAAKGRTTIAVAHRLSTIQNADIIYVIDNGKVLESGTHQQLLANQSKYFELVQMQSLAKN